MTPTILDAFAPAGERTMSSPLLSDEFLAPERSTSLATRSLLFACLGFVFFAFGIAAVVTGTIAFRKAGREPSLFGGRKRAVAAITIGCISTLSCSPLSCGVMLPALTRARQHAQHILSGNQMKEIVAALNKHAEAHGAYPAEATNLESLLKPVPPAIDLRFLSAFGGTRPDQSSYLYIAPASRPARADAPRILLIENPVLSRRTINVVDTTGTVRLLTHEEAKSLLADTPTLWTTKGERTETADLFGRAAQ